MNKVIHAAVRRDLARLENALGRVSDGDRQRAKDLNRAWRQLAAQLRHHHQQEDTVLFPVVVSLGVDRELVATMEAEHRVMSEALAGIETAMAEYAGTGSAVAAATAAEAVRHGQVVVGRHLDHEESELEPLMLAHEDTPEWQTAMRQVRKQPPRTTGWFFAWLEDGAGEEEAAYLAGTVPAPVRYVFGRLFGRGYHRQIAPVWR